jgi:hypothetical protein
MSTTWPIIWPASANIESAEALHKLLAEQYASDTLRTLTLGRVGGNPITVIPDAAAPGRVDAILLKAPVGRVDEVTVAGLPLLPAAYAVENGAFLVRTDGGSWPVGAVTVTYLNGYPVNELGQHIGGILAAEYLKMITRDKGCRLPSSVTNIQRQGLALEIKTGLFPDGLTKIPEVDHYIYQWNPNGLKTKPAVYSPDLPEHRQVSWRIS